MAGNSFFEKVYDVVAAIPTGKVMTYGQISSLLGGVCSARIVGYAMSCAPAVYGLPCHRVVNRLGEMAQGPMFGGSARQRELLEREGVFFGPDGRIDLVASLFRPGEQTIVHHFAPTHPYLW